MDMDLFLINWRCSFCFMGIICIALSAYLKYKANKLMSKCTSSCTGVLNEICEKLKSDRDTDGYTRKRIFYFPIYEFEVNGKKYKIRDTTGNISQENFEIGKNVEIKYNPENPEECYKKGDIFSKIWLVFLIAGILSIIDGLGIGYLIQVMNNT